MNRFVLKALLASVAAGLISQEVKAQWIDRNWGMNPLGRNSIDVVNRYWLLDQGDADLRATARQEIANLRNAANQPEPPPSPNLRFLIGSWSIRGRDADGSNWTGAATIGANRRMAASFRRMSPWGAVSQGAYTASFGYYANDNIQVVVDRPFQVQVNRIDWVNADRFIVTPRFGAQLTYDRVR